MGFTELSTIDWPGRLVTIVFLQGCDFRCPWCQNVDGIDPKGGKESSTQEVIKHLKELTPLIDSVVLTGGEPLLQPRASLELLKGAKELGLSRAIETNGSYPRVLKELLPYLDLVAIDIKAPLSDPALYAKVIGLTDADDLVQKIRRSLALAINSDAEVEVRTTVIPTLNDDEEVIARIAREIKGADRFRLQQFRGLQTFDPAFQKLPSPSRERLIKLAKIAKQRGVEDVIIFTTERGLEEIR